MRLAGSGFWFPYSIPPDLATAGSGCRRSTRWMHMLTLTRASTAKAGATNVEFVKGQIKGIPLPDESIDVVGSGVGTTLNWAAPADQQHPFIDPRRPIRTGIGTPPPALGQAQLPTAPLTGVSHFQGSGTHLALPSLMVGPTSRTCLRG